MDKFAENNSDLALKAESRDLNTNTVVPLSFNTEVQTFTRDTNMSIEEFSQLVGEYTLVIVFTQKIDGEDVVILDTNEPAYITRFMGFDIPDTVDENGVTHFYSAKSAGGKLVVTVSS